MKTKSIPLTQKVIPLSTKVIAPLPPEDFILIDNDLFNMVDTDTDQLIEDN